MRKVKFQPGKVCCRVCDNRLHYIKDIPGEETGENIALYKCCFCKSYFTRVEFLLQSPGDENSEDITGYIDSENYVRGRVDDIISHAISNEWISGSGTKFLDIGCGVGWSLDVAKNKGLLVSGIEPVNAASNYAKEKLDLLVINSFFKSDLFNGEKFDFIMMDQVLEHIPNPLTVLHDAFKLLKKDGIFFLSVPPVDWSRVFTSMSYMFPAKIVAKIKKSMGGDRILELANKYDTFCCPEGHINYFTANSVDILAKKCNAEIIEQYHSNKIRGRYFPLLNLTTGSYFLRKL